MKPCSKIKQFIPLAVSQDLAESEQVLLDRHLPDCPDCRAELASYRALRQKMLAAGELAESDAFWNNYTEKVMMAVNREESITPHLKANQPYLFLKFVRAAAVFLIGLTIGYAASLILSPKSSSVNESLQKQNYSGRYQSGILFENNLLGVKCAPVSPALANHLQITPNQGLVITDFLTRSPAKEIGLRSGDILMEFNGQPITSTGIFTYLKNKEPIELKVIRKGEITFIKINLKKDK